MALSHAVPALPPSTRIFGIDFTSAPRKAKPITIAGGRLEPPDIFALEAVDAVSDFAAFEAWLARPGPWIAGIDAPFGMPREAQRDLCWPAHWPALVDHCRALGRAGFRAALDRYRESRPPGSRYAHRVADAPAGSHSPLKLVNPPVGLMFLECAPRLLDAGATIPGIHAGDPRRVALEAYPGFIARALCPGSYKSDDRAKHTPERSAARRSIVRQLSAGAMPLALKMRASGRLRDQMVADASGDTLDAVLAAMQAAWAFQRRRRGFGLPPHIDPIEGWIACVPAPGGIA